MAEPAEGPVKQREGGRKPSLHSHIMQMEPLTDRLLRWLPEWVRDIVQDRRRQLLYVERQMQRRLVNEFRAQARELEPVLRARGRMVGEVLIEAVVSSSDTDLTYAEIVADSLEDTVVGERLPVREVLSTLDPLLTPFITPFVEGIKSPINDKADELRTHIISRFAMSVAGGMAAGFLLGRVLPRGGGGDSGGGSSGGGGRGGGRRG